MTKINKKVLNTHVNPHKKTVTAGTKHVPKPGYEYQSALAKTVWVCEKNLPKPMLTGEILQPAVYLADILQYARGAESRGEYLFRKNWLLPFVKKFVAANETNSSWEDAMGNIVVHIGGEKAFDTLHVGHIDTVHSDDKSPIQQLGIRSMNRHGNHKFKDDRELFLKPIVKNSVPKQKTGIRWVNDVREEHIYIDYDLPMQSGSRCLGADDGCAVAIMCWMMQHQIAGTYLFTRGEERGCVGTKYMIDKADLDFSKFKRAIEVDRKGEDEIITKMSPGMTASPLFARSLAAALNMGHAPSDRGSITDVGHLAELIPECVNVAAGYYRQHSESETTNPDYLNRLGRAMLTVEWDTLEHLRAAGEFTVKVVKHNYSNNPRTYNNQQSLYSSLQTTPKNKFGDYTDIDFSSEEPILEEFPTEWQIAQFIRSNTGFIGEFLAALEVTPREMHDICMFGLETELSAYDPEPDDVDPEEEFEGQPEEKAHTLEKAPELLDDDAISEALIAIEAEKEAEIDEKLDLDAVAKLSVH